MGLPLSGMAGREGGRKGVGLYRVQVITLLVGLSFQMQLSPQLNACHLSRPAPKQLSLHPCSLCSTGACVSALLMRAWRGCCNCFRQVAGCGCWQHVCQNTHFPTPFWAVLTQQFLVFFFVSRRWSLTITMNPSKGTSHDIMATRLIYDGWGQK